MINFFDEHDKIPDFNSEFFSLWISGVEKKEGVQLGDVNFIFQDNEFIRKMNVDYLEHDYDTDVITFDYSENNFIAGDIFINVDYIHEYANKNSISFLKELSRIMIHGVLHLCGYDDKSESDKMQMTAREDFYLSLQ